MIFAGCDVGIKLGGAALADTLLSRLSLLDYVESIDELDALSLRFDLPASSGADLLDLVAPGKTFDITIEGEHGTLTAAGDILEAGLSFEASGWWSVQLRGLEGLHRLRGAQTPAVWTGAPTSYLGTIARRHSLGADIQGVDAYPEQVLQADEDDAHFVKRLGLAWNYSARVKGGKLVFARRHVAAGTKLSLTMHDVQGLRLDTSLYDTLTKVTVSADDPTKGELVQSSAEKVKLKKISGGDDAATLRTKAFGARAEVIHNGMATTVSLAEALAVARLQEAAETLVTGRVRAMGRLDAVSGALFEITDAPWPVTGPFLMRQVRHLIDPDGCATEIDLLSDSLPTP
jgi:hypothetical protein